MAYEKRIKNHVCIQQLVFDEDTEIETAKKITEEFVDSVGDRFQVVTGLSRNEGGGCTMTMVTNQVSYVGGKGFYDNNGNYARILKEMSEKGIRISAKEKVYFDNKDLKKAYG